MFTNNFRSAFLKCLDTSGADPAIRVQTVTGGTAVTGTLRMGQLDDVTSKLFKDNGDGTFSLYVQV